MNKKEKNMLEQKLRELIKEAMKNHKEEAKLTYKSILENAQKLAKEKKEEVNDSYIIASAKKEIKQLTDFLEYCEQNSDKYEEANRKIDLAKGILPKMAEADEIRDYLVTNNIDKNMGICMKTLKEHFKDSLDGKQASKVVKEYINN
jgi:uncharacterized protein YqeY